MTAADQIPVRGDDNVWHIIASNMQDIKARIGLKGRALCGAQLQLRGNAEYPTDEAPECPRCAALNR